MTDPTPQVWQSGECFFATPKDVTLSESELKLLGLIDDFRHIAMQEFSFSKAIRLR